MSMYLSYNSHIILIWWLLIYDYYTYYSSNKNHMKAMFACLTREFKEVGLFLLSNLHGNKYIIYFKHSLSFKGFITPKIWIYLAFWKKYSYVVKRLYTRCNLTSLDPIFNFISNFKFMVFLELRRMTLYYWSSFVKAIWNSTSGQSLL